MRSVSVLAALAAIATASPSQASDPPGRPRTDDLDKTLTAAEVQRYIEPYYPAVRGCFLEHTPAVVTDLRVELIIHRDGSVFRLLTSAPGVSGTALRRLDRCLQEQASGWHFPVRGGFTSAVVPYRFVRTVAPGAGPQPSCWSPQGCPTKKESR